MKMQNKIYPVKVSRDFKITIAIGFVCVSGIAFALGWIARGAI
jgi:hypothetical protein